MNTYLTKYETINYLEDIISALKVLLLFFYEKEENKCTSYQNLITL